MIPENAKIVFQGKIIRVYQWNQLMYDGTYDLFEKVWRNASTEVISTQGNKILLAYQSQPHKTEPFYSFFGGCVDNGEAPLDAAHRELLEESGFKTDDMSFYGKYAMHGNGNDSHIYVAKDVYKVAEQHLDPGEKIEIIEKSFDELIQLMIYGHFRTNRDFLINIMRLKIDGRIDEFRNVLFGK